MNYTVLTHSTLQISQHRSANFQNLVEQALNIDAQNLEVKNNVTARRFEVQLGGQIAVIDYHKHGSVYVLTHAEVPSEYRGQGIADRMAYFALETARAEKAQVVPQCPFVRAYIRRHKEYQSLVAPNRTDNS